MTSKAIKDFVEMLKRNKRHAQHPLTKFLVADAVSVIKVFNAIMESPEYIAMTEDKLGQCEQCNGTGLVNMTSCCECQIKKHPKSD